MSVPHFSVVAVVFAILLPVFIYFMYHIGRLKAEIRRWRETQTLFFENIHVIVLIIDPSDGSIVDANIAASRFYGYAREELVNMNICQINTLDSNEIKSTMQATVKNERTTKYYFRHRLANGNIKDVEVFSGPISINGKQMLYSVVADSSKKKTEEMLQCIRNEVSMLCLDSTDLQELLDKSVEIIHGIDGIFGCSICILDEGKNILTVRAGTAISEEERESLYNDKIMNMLTEIAYGGKPIYYENIDSSNEYLRPFMQVGIKSIAIIPVKRNDIILGTLNAASASLNELPEETKRLLQSIAYSIGIAFLRLNSDMRKDEAEDRWKFALEENGDIIVDVDVVNGRVVNSGYFNQVIGFPDKPVVDIMNDWESLIYEEDLPVLQKAFDEHLRGKLEKILVEIRIMTRDGKYKWFLVRGKTVKQDSRKSPMRLIIVLTEVTYLKNYEQELLKSKQAVEASNKVKDLFLANISHELRTPMNGIIGMTQLMELSGVSGEQQDNISIIKESSSRMMQLINNLITLTSMEAEEVSVNESSFSLRNLILKILAEYEKDASGKGIELIENIEKELPQELLGDSGKLSEILRQLVDNGVKFTNRGFVQVSAAKVSEQPDGKSIKVRISVEDTGSGIENEDLHKLFGNFAQLDDSYTRKYQGAGLGLAICNKLASILGAKIEVQSKPGKGTSFNITADFKKVEVVPDKQDVKNIKGNVLIADDDEISRRLLGILCEKNRLKVQYAVNGREAVEKCMENNYDLVFMDIQMPELSGIEAMRLIRSLEHTDSNIPYIVAVTAYALKNDKARFISEGFDDYISKPIDTSELVALAKKWIVQRNENRLII